MTRYHTSLASRLRQTATAANMICSGQDSTYAAPAQTDDCCAVRSHSLSCVNFHRLPCCHTHDHQTSQRHRQRERNLTCTLKTTVTGLPNSVPSLSLSLRAAPNPSRTDNAPPHSYARPVRCGPNRAEAVPFVIGQTSNSKSLESMFGWYFENSNGSARFDLASQRSQKSSGENWRKGLRRLRVGRRLQIV
jgi:hypothetical protein